MAVISTGLLTKGLRSEFFERFNATSTFYGDLTTPIQSNADQETYRHLGQVPVMREWGTGRKVQGLNVESYTVANLKYESTLEVDRDEISDDQTGQIRIRVQELALRAATHKDYLLSQLCINGASAGFLASDGQIFFGAAHVWASSGTQDNDLTFDVGTNATALGEPDDVDNPGPKTIQLAFDQAWGAMATFKDDRGEPVNFGMTGLVVLVHPQAYLKWLTAIQSTLLNNTGNVLTQFAIRVVPIPWFTDVSMWYLLKTDSVLRPFIFQNREPVEFVSLAEGSTEEFLREKYLYGVRARYRLTYGRWQSAVRTNFTT